MSNVAYNTVSVPKFEKLPVVLTRKGRTLLRYTYFSSHFSVFCFSVTCGLLESQQLKWQKHSHVSVL